jgi:hypothetical protein
MRSREKGARERKRASERSSCKGKRKWPHLLSHLRIRTRMHPRREGSWGEEKGTREGTTAWSSGEAGSHSTSFTIATIPFNEGSPRACSHSAMDWISIRAKKGFIIGTRRRDPWERNKEGRLQPVPLHVSSMDRSRERGPGRRVQPMELGQPRDGVR